MSGTVALVLVGVVFELRLLAEAVLAHHEDVFIFVVGAYHADDSIVVAIEGDTFYARSATAHLAELVLNAAYHFSVLRGDEQFALAIGETCGDKFVALADADSDNAVGARTGVGFERGLLHHTPLGTHNDVVALQVLWIAEVADIHEGFHLVVGLNINHIEYGTAFGVLLPFRHLEGTHPVAAAFLGKEQEVVVVSAHKDMFDKVFAAHRAAFGADTSASLRTVFVEESALDVSHVGDGDDHLVVGDGVLDAEVRGFVFDGCATVVAVFVADFFQLAFDDAHEHISVAEDFFAAGDETEFLVVFVLQFLAFHAGELTQTHLDNGLCLEFAELPGVHQALLGLFD